MSILVRYKSWFLALVAVLYFVPIYEVKADEPVPFPKPSTVGPPITSTNSDSLQTSYSNHYRPNFNISSEPFQAPRVDPADRLDTAQKAFLMEHEFSKLSAVEQKRSLIFMEFRQRLENDYTNYPDWTGRSNQLNRIAHLAADSFDRVARSNGTGAVPSSSEILEDFKKSAASARDLVPVNSKGFPDPTQTAVGPLSVFIDFADSLNEAERLQQARLQGVDTRQPTFPLSTPLRDPEFFYREVEYLKKHPDIAATYTRYLTTVTNGRNFAKESGPSLLAGNADAHREYTQTLEIFKLHGLVAKLGAKNTRIEGDLKKVTDALAQRVAQASADLDQQTSNAGEQAKQGEKKELTEEEKKDLREQIDADFAPWIKGANFLAGIVTNPDLKKSLYVAGTSLNAGRIATQVFSRALNPVMGAMAIGELVQGLFNLFNGSPDINLMILQEVQALRREVAKMHFDMMEQFGILREEIAFFHRQTDGRFDRLEKLVAVLFERQYSASLAIGQGVVEIKKDQKLYHDQARFRDYDTALTNYRANLRSARTRPGRGNNALTFAEAREQLKASHDLGTAGACTGVYAGDPILGISGNLNTARFCETVGKHLPSYAITGDVIRPLSDACQQAGNPICSAPLPNPNRYSEAASDYISFAKTRPQFYRDLHSESPFDETGNETSTTAHANILNLISSGNSLQLGIHRMAWGHDPQTNEVSLNDRFIEDIANAHSQRFRELGQKIESDASSYLKNVIEAEKMLADSKGPTVPIPNQIGACNPGSEFEFKHTIGTKEKPSPLPLSEDQKAQLNQLLPKVVRLYAQQNEGVEIEFCIGGTEIWDEAHQEVISREQLPDWLSHDRGDTRNAEEKAAAAREHIKVWNVGKPGFVLIAKLKHGPGREKLVFSKKVVLPKHLKSSIYYGDQYVQGSRPYGNWVADEMAAKNAGLPDYAERWPDEILRRWKSGELPSVLFSSGGVEQNSLRVGLELKYFDSWVERTRVDAIEQGIKNLTEKYGDKQTPDVYQQLMAIEGARQMAQRVSEMGLEYLVQNNDRFRNALQALDGIHEVSSDLERDQEKFGDPQKMRSFIQERIDQGIELREAYHSAIASAERKSIAQFLEENRGKTNSQELSRKYYEEYGNRSELRNLGHKKSVDGTVQMLEDFYSEKMGEEFQPEFFDSEHQRIQGNLKPQSVWGEGDIIPLEIPICGLERTTHRLSDNEREALKSEVLSNLSPQMAIEVRIGLQKTSLCMDIHEEITFVRDNSHRTIRVSFGEDQNTANVLLRRSKDFRIAKKLSTAGTPIVLKMTPEGRGRSNPSLSRKAKSELDRQLPIENEKPLASKAIDLGKGEGTQVRQILRLINKRINLQGIPKEALVLYKSSEAKYQQVSILLEKLVPDGLTLEQKIGALPRRIATIYVNEDLREFQGEIDKTVAMRKELAAQITAASQAQTEASDILKQAEALSGSSPIVASTQ